ncbi:DUF3742 family protein [Pseudomonas oryzihabitans]|uniref:DUF3742 family protein n=1 Tax=Pseudomonas oryzihabitans TaxID=47885 RepID=UPI0028959B7D|nr:DUF3742 family protein [Pseudomonas oryzihabitans]MDT3722670.1 DUF3742 family protein [Pseudomonas oryzihabitans]
MASAVFAKFVGKILGQSASLIMRGESRVCLLLASVGFSSRAMTFVKWLLRLAIVVVALIVAAKTMFFVLIGVMAVVAATALITGPHQDAAEDALSGYGAGKFGEWRDGDTGYGHYDSFGQRDDNYGK